MAAYLILVLVSRVRRIFPMQTSASPTLVCLLAHNDDSAITLKAAIITAQHTIAGIPLKNYPQNPFP